LYDFPLSRDLDVAVQPDKPRDQGEIEPDSVGHLTATLPAWVYYSQDFFEAEKQKIFLSSWQLVGHTSDLPEPGCYITFQLYEERAVVVRTQDDEIKAFHNVCRHRAHILLNDDRGTCPGKFVCPYHGWTYDLEGNRTAIGHPTSFLPHDAQHFALSPVDMEIYGGFIFIRFRSEGAGVAERMSPVHEEFMAYQTLLMTPEEKSETKPVMWTHAVDADWKVGVENFIEDYHFFIGHRGLFGLMEEQYDREPLGPDVARLSHKMRARPQPSWSAEAYNKLLPDQTHLPKEMRRRWTYYALYPNNFFDCYPDQVNFFQILPVAPGKSLLRCQSYVLQDDSRAMRATRYLNSRINDRVQDEDNDLIESVQKGLISSSYQSGVLSDKENLVKHFADFIRDKIPSAAANIPVKSLR
tara:strand:- start:158 stop:1390 length:1233 start_codon:yes stop_codon:yes gene_type:complete